MVHTAVHTEQQINNSLRIAATSENMHPSSWMHFQTVSLLLVVYVLFVAQCDTRYNSTSSWNTWSTHRGCLCGSKRGVTGTLLQLLYSMRCTNAGRSKTPQIPSIPRRLSCMSAYLVDSLSLALRFELPRMFWT